MDGGNSETHGPRAVTGAEFLGPGIGFAGLVRERPDMAGKFARSVEVIADRLGLHGGRAAASEPFADWTFHRVSQERWIARLATYRNTEPLYVEWNCHLSDWDAERVQSSLGFLVEDTTQPHLRTRPRATRSKEAS